MIFRNHDNHQYYKIKKLLILTNFISMNPKIRIGGVPEHFNLPWHLAEEENLFDIRDLDLDWKDFPGGTGAMTKALRNNEIDVAILLTEGIVKDIIHGNPSTIVGIYIQSPLQWGIHVGAKSSFYELNDLEGRSAAISRFGSGSHLMAYVNADNQGWNIDQLKFEKVGNLEGGHQALVEGTADYFLWEKYTTKPFVDQGNFRRIGVCPTPWPSFVIAIRNEFLEQEYALVEKLLKTIYQSNFAFVNNPDSCAQISERYQLDFKDIKQWYAETEWAIDCTVNTQMLDKVQEKLLQLGHIEETVVSKGLIWEKSLADSRFL